MVSPDAVEMKQPAYSEHEENEGNDRCEDLNEIALEYVRRSCRLKPSKSARVNSRARELICKPEPKERAAPPAGGRADAILRDFAMLERYARLQSLDPSRPRRNASERRTAGGHFELRGRASCADSHHDGAETHLASGANWRAAGPVAVAPKPPVRVV
jgi:hypothetical protein